MKTNNKNTSNLSHTHSIQYADWVNRTTESEIRRLLRFSPRYYFAGGQPGIVPIQAFHEIIERIVNQEKELIKANNHSMISNYLYGKTEGNSRLRGILANRLESHDGLDGVTSSMVTITTGSQQMIYSLCDSLLNPGDIILTARPTYLGFVHPAEKLGGNIITIPSDDQGIIPEFIPRAFKACYKKFRKTPKFLYCVPYSDNPKGTTLTTQRKNTIFDYSIDLDFLIIEDAAYKEIQFNSEKYFPIKQLDKDNERVAYLSTTTKEAAAFRIGYSVLPSGIRDAVIKAKGFYDLCSSEWVQAILAIYYEEYIDKLLPEIRLAYKKQRNSMVNAIKKNLPGHNTQPTGGFFVWFETNERSFNSSKFIESSIKNDVMYVPGAAFYPKFGHDLKNDGSLMPSKPKFNCMRLGYSLLEPNEITIGIKHLGSLLDTHLRKKRKIKLNQSSLILSSLYY
ncbi:MAG: aminotransferase-like domain-containing protein [Candidatus Hodarchaeales archaeon]